MLMFMLHYFVIIIDFIEKRQNKLENSPNIKNIIVQNR